MKRAIASLTLILALAACEPPETGGGEETRPDCAPGADLCAD